jgi:type VI secretion system secreted protein Hcp
VPVYFGKGKVHGVSLGLKAISPADLKRIEGLNAFKYGVQSPVDANTGQPSGKRQHALNLQALNCGKAFSYGIESPLDTANGQVTGKRQHSSLMIRKEVDAESSFFHAALVSNKVLQTLSLNFAKTNHRGTLHPHLTITLNGVAFAGYRRLPHRGKQKSISELEEISFVYQEIAVAFLWGSTSSSDDWATG